MPLQNVIHIVLSSGYMDIFDRVRFSMVNVAAAERLVRVESLIDGICQTSMAAPIKFSFWTWALKKACKDLAKEAFSNHVEFYTNNNVMDSMDLAKLTKSQVNEIMRDVKRTFPNHPLFVNNGSGNVILARILISFANSNQEVGYCQGMNFVAGALVIARLWDEIFPTEVEKYNNNFAKSEDSLDDDKLTNIESKALLIDFNHQAESEILLLLNLLISCHGKLDMQSMWKPGFPKMKLRVYQFDRLLQCHMIELHEHFMNIGLQIEVIVSQWFITLFANTVPLEQTLHLWDYIFLIGWPGVFRIALALMYYLHDEILEMEMEEIGLMLRDWKRGKFSVTAPSNDIILKAEQFGVFDDTLELLHESFAIELLCAVLGSEVDSSFGVCGQDLRFSRGVDEYQGSVELLRIENVTDEMKDDMRRVLHDLKHLEDQVEHDKNVLQKKLMKACEACEISYTRLDMAAREETYLQQKVEKLNEKLDKYHVEGHQVIENALQIGMLSEFRGYFQHHGVAFDANDDADQENENEDEDDIEIYHNNESHRPNNGTEADDEDSYNQILAEGSITSEMEFGCSDTEIISNSSSTPLCELSSSAGMEGEAHEYFMSMNAVADKISSHPARRRLNSTSASMGPKRVIISPNEFEKSSGYSRRSPTSQSNKLMSTKTPSPVQIIMSQQKQQHFGPSHEDDKIVVEETATESTLASIGLDEFEDSVDEHVAVNTPHSQHPNHHNNYDNRSDSDSSLNDYTFDFSSEDHPSEERLHSFDRTHDPVPPVPALEQQNSNKGLFSYMFKAFIPTTEMKPEAPKEEVLPPPLTAEEEAAVNLKKRSKKILKKIKTYKSELQASQLHLHAAMEKKQTLVVADEEARQWKESLCFQFQQLVQDANRGRYQKLLYIAESYGIL